MPITLDCNRISTGLSIPFRKALKILRRAEVVMLSTTPTFFLRFAAYTSNSDWQVYEKSGVPIKDILQARIMAYFYRLARLILFFAAYSLLMLALMAYLPDASKRSQDTSQWAKAALSSNLFLATELILTLSSVTYLLLRSPRSRLLVNVTVCVQYLDEINDIPTLSPFRMRMRSIMANRAYRRRKFNSLAWAINRDCLILSGVSRSDASVRRIEGLGQTLLWYENSPLDRRRRPIAIEGIKEALEYAISSKGKRIRSCELAASRFDVLPPRYRILAKVGEVASGALVTGITIAIVTALFRAWIK